MIVKIIIDSERCKGCGLCITACPKNSIVIAEDSNKNGYFPAEAKSDDCTGCAACATMCPETVIEVYRQRKIVELKPEKIKKPDLSKVKG